MVEVKRKQGESVEGMVRRFSSRIRRTKKLTYVKKAKFRQKPKSKTIRRQEALRRKKTRERKEYLRKTGVLKEAPRGYDRRKRR